MALVVADRTTELELVHNGVAGLLEGRIVVVFEKFHAAAVDAASVAFAYHAFFGE